MFRSIDKLATDINESWARVGYADDEFCNIAATHLATPLNIDFDTVARGVCKCSDLPQQRRNDQAFGQPGITLYHGDRFIIEALCWHSGTPAIHQHAFSGAFRVVTGRSVHSRYSFTELDCVGQIMLGELRLQSVELLDNDQIVQIPRGRGLIHSAFHLDIPSMTVVARTHQTNEPEYTYLPPGVAYDSAARSPSLYKRLQMLDTLNITHHDAYHECVSAAIDGADLYDCMAIIMRVGSHRVDEAKFLAYTQRLRERHGSGIGTLISALIEERRRGIIVRLRGAVADEDVRFFMASLLSFTCRMDLLNAMQQRYGDTETALGHIAEGVACLLGGDSDRKQIIAAATRAIFEDVPPLIFPGYATRLWDRVFSDHEATTLRQFYEQLMKHPLLTPLVSQDGSSTAPKR